MLSLEFTPNNMFKAIKKYFDTRVLNNFTYLEQFSLRLIHGIPTRKEINLV